jgi:hypothetical protein
MMDAVDDAGDKAELNKTNDAGRSSAGDLHTVEAKLKNKIRKFAQSHSWFSPLVKLVYIVLFAFLLMIPTTYHILSIAVLVVVVLTTFFCLLIALFAKPQKPINETSIFSKHLFSILAWSFAIGAFIVSNLITWFFSEYMNDRKTLAASTGQVGTPLQDFWNTYLWPNVSSLFLIFAVILFFWIGIDAFRMTRKKRLKALDRGLNHLFALSKYVGGGFSGTVKNQLSAVKQVRGPIHRVVRAVGTFLTETWWWVLACNCLCVPLIAAFWPIISAFLASLL